MSRKCLAFDLFVCFSLQLLYNDKICFVNLSYFFFKGLLDIQPKLALAIGISTVIGAGLTYGSVKLLNSIYNDRPPKKFVRSI